MDEDADADAEHMNKEAELDRNHCNSTVRVVLASIILI